MIINKLINAMYYVVTARDNSIESHISGVKQAQDKVWFFIDIEEAIQCIERLESNSSWSDIDIKYCTKIVDMR